MEIIITAKTSNKNPTQKELDKSVDLVLTAGETIANKIKDYDIVRCRCSRDGTSLILVKNG